MAYATFMLIRSPHCPMSTQHRPDTITPADADTQRPAGELIVPLPVFDSSADDKTASR